MSDAFSRYHSFARNTPQTQPIPGRESEMVKNDAGGYVFTKDLWTRLSDFIILGTEGGTYYADEKTHTYRNIKSVNEALAADGPRAVQLAVEISTARPPRAPKNFPALYVVAAALASPDVDTRRAACDAVHRVARTTDHLSHLFGYYKAVTGREGGGGGRLIKRAWASWFTSDTPDAVAYRILKSRQRSTGSGETFRPGDLLALARPRPVSEVQEAMFQLARGHKSPMDVSGHLSAAKAFYEANRVRTPAEAVRAINAYHVPWEFLPDEVLKFPAVWEALVPHLGLTAVIRNLVRMTTIGTLGPFKQANQVVVRRLTDPAELSRARIHPFDVLLASRVYAQGWSQPHARADMRRWTPVGAVQSALNQAYRLSFAAAPPVDARLVIAVDKSGSMSGAVRHGGTDIGSAYHVCSAIAHILDRLCTRTWLMEFDSTVVASKVHADQGLSEIFNLPHNGGSTDVSAPIRWALTNKVEVDGFVLLTDNETWSGRQHAVQALADYRRKINPNARVLDASVRASGTSPFPGAGSPGGNGCLDVAGFDSALPALIAGFFAPAGAGAGEGVV